MSKRHPVVAVTGSSGAGTSTVKRAFEHIFARESITPAVGSSAPMLLGVASCRSPARRGSSVGGEAVRKLKIENLGGVPQVYVVVADGAANFVAEYG